MTEWARIHGVTCVVCPGCAFTFSDEHTDAGTDDRYSCPCCGYGSPDKEERESRDEQDREEAAADFDRDW